MKKIIGLAVLCIGFQTVLAQDEREEFRVGLKGGLNFASLIQDEQPNLDVTHKLGYVGGGFLSIPLNKYFGLQPEILVSQKGFVQEARYFGVDTKLERTTTYLDIPLMLQFKPVANVALVGGVQYSYLMRSKDVLTIGNSSAISEEQYENDQLNKNLFGVVGGIDVTIQNFLLFGRYNLDLRSNNGDGTSSVPAYKNQVIQVGVGVVF